MKHEQKPKHTCVKATCEECNCRIDIIQLGKRIYEQARLDTYEEVLMFLNEHSASEYRDLECINWLEAEIKKLEAKKHG